MYKIQNQYAFDEYQLKNNNFVEWVEENLRYKIFNEFSKICKLGRIYTTKLVREEREDFWYNRPIKIVTYILYYKEQESEI